MHMKSFAEGDQVLAYSPHRFKGRTPKWQRMFSQQAYVFKRFNDVSYLVRNANARGKKGNRVVHVDKLRPFPIAHSYKKGWFDGGILPP
jgi:hypothetical protein